MQLNQIYPALIIMALSFLGGVAYEEMSTAPASEAALGIVVQPEASLPASSASSEVSNEVIQSANRDDDDDEEEHEDEEEEDDDDDDNKKVATPVTPVKTTPKPSTATPTPAIAPSTTKVVSYTPVQVAAHATEANCWTAIDGSVYDLTSFINDHPGGKQNILKICGKDGTATFMDQHSGDRKPSSELAGLKIGILSN